MNLSAAFGCAYVLERVILGERTPVGMLEKRRSRPTASFFMNYDAVCGERWGNFTRLLESVPLNPAATETSRALSGWLTRMRPEIGGWLLLSILSEKCRRYLRQRTAVAPSSIRMGRRTLGAERPPSCSRSNIICAAARPVA